MRVQAVFSPEALTSGALAGRIALVIDVLRASTTIATALANGAQAIVPCGNPEEARARLAEMPPGEGLLGGERRALRLAGFALGNSPLEYTGERVGQRIIFYTTTNGTRALLAAREAVEVGVAAFVNVTAATRWARAAGRDLMIICAGDQGGFSMEDAACGGMVIERLHTMGLTLALDDAARAASLLYRASAARIPELLAESKWGRRLREGGLGPDVVACGQIDRLDGVPVLTGDRIILAPRAAARGAAGTDAVGG